MKYFLDKLKNFLKRVNIAYNINKRLAGKYIDGWDTGVIYIRKNYFNKGYTIDVLTEDYGDFSIGDYKSKSEAISIMHEYAKKIRNIIKEVATK